MARGDDEALAATVATVLSEPLTPGLDATVAAGTRSAAPARVPEDQRYAVGPMLGSGGMGEVLSASDRRIGRDVALKRTRVVPSPELAARFLREAQLQGRLDHPAIVPVYDLGVDDDGRPYFVMKRLTGTCLDAVIGASDATWSRRKQLTAFVEVCLAIEFAHTRGVVHRDLKPANIMLGDFGEVYVLDWGVARVLHDAAAVDGVDVSAALPSLDGTDADTGTRAGAVLGTPGYMAPEQARGETVTPASDVYALGATLFEILAGQPFARGRLDASEVDATPSHRGPEVPPELDAICARALAPEPSARWPSARALADRVQRYLDGDRDLARRDELARQHLVDARAALAEVDGRARALRAAGQALALSPGSAEAAALVSRLMLEPPAVPPPEVRAELRAADERVVRKSARRSVWNFAALCTMIPVALTQGNRRPVAVVIFVLIAGVAIANAARIGFGRVPVTRRRLYVAFAVNVVLVGLLSRAFGPFLVVPAIATAALVSFAGLPLVDRPWLLATMASLAVVAPWLVEAVGLAEPSMAFVDGALVIRSASFQMSELPMLILLLGHAVVVMFVAAHAAHGPSANERAARDQLAVQAWQLRQMVPDAGDTGASTTGGDRGTNGA